MQGAIRTEERRRSGEAGGGIRAKECEGTGKTAGEIWAKQLEGSGRVLSNCLRLRPSSLLLCPPSPMPSQKWTAAQAAPIVSATAARAWRPHSASSRRILCASAASLPKSGSKPVISSSRHSGAGASSRPMTGLNCRHHSAKCSSAWRSAARSGATRFSSAAARSFLSACLTSSE